MLAPRMAHEDTHGIVIVAVSVAILLLGPLIHRVARRKRATMAALDSFVLVAVVVLVLLEVLPRGLQLAGWPAFLAAALGLVAPTIAEGPLRLAAGRTHRAALALTTIGMAFHALTDGLALASGHVDGARSHGLEVAIVAHQLPVAVASWWLLAPSSQVLATAALVLMGAATFVGYFVADASVGWFDDTWLGLFEAMIGGLLLHVLAHRSHATGGARAAAGVGGLLGLGLVVMLASESHGADDPLARTLAALAELLRDSAPALLLAYALAGLVAGLMPEAPVRWLRRGGPATQALRGMAVGLPLPLCSCGVVPVYTSLLQRGVPAAAAMAFFVATPELGLDAILLSWPLLGEELTLLRVAAAALVAWLVGWLVGGRVRDREVVAVDDGGARGTLGQRLVAGLRTGFGELVDTTAPWIGLGLVLAAMITPWIDPGALTGIPGPLQVVVFAVIGVPLYVCASGATPLVAALLAKGLSPGAALAFLLTGPATNATTFGVLTQEHGKATAVRFAAAMLALAIALGIAVDLALPGLAAVAGADLHAEHGWFSEAAMWAVAGLFLVSFVRQGPHGFLARLWERGGHKHDHDHDHDHDHGHHHHHDHDHAHHDHAGHGHGDMTDRSGHVHADRHSHGCCGHDH